MATLILANQADINPQPDGKELISLKWFSLTEARNAVNQTNHQEKAILLLKSLDACEKDLIGTTLEIKKAVPMKD